MKLKSERHGEVIIGVSRPINSCAAKSSLVPDRRRNSETLHKAPSSPGREPECTVCSRTAIRPIVPSSCFCKYAGRFAFYSSLWYRYRIRTATRANALLPSDSLKGRLRRGDQSAWNLLYVLGKARSSLPPSATPGSFGKRKEDAPGSHYMCP